MSDESDAAPNDALRDAIDSIPIGFALLGSDGRVWFRNQALTAWCPAFVGWRGSHPELELAVGRAFRGEQVVLDATHERLPEVGMARLTLGPTASGQVWLLVERTVAEVTFRELVGAAAEGILLVRRNTILYANDQLRRWLGYDRPSDVVGRSLLEVTAPDAQPLLPEASHPEDERGWTLLDREGKAVPALVVGGVHEDGGLSLLMVRLVARAVEAVRRSPRWSQPVPTGSNSDADESGSAERKPTPVVLVCDDEARLAMLTCGLLEQHGISAQAAATAEAAFVALDARHFDAMLLDLHLPDASAEEVIARLRARQHSPPVVLTSGYAAEDLPPDLIRQAPVVGYLAKPYSVDLLITEVRRAIEQRGSTRLAVP